MLANEPRKLDAEGLPPAHVCPNCAQISIEKKRPQLCAELRGEACTYAQEPDPDVARSRWSCLMVDDKTSWDIDSINSLGAMPSRISHQLLDVGRRRSAEQCHASKRRAASTMRLAHAVRHSLAIAGQHGCYDIKKALRSVGLNPSSIRSVRGVFSAPTSLQQNFVPLANPCTCYSIKCSNVPPSLRSHRLCSLAQNVPSSELCKTFKPRAHPLRPIPAYRTGAGRV